MVYNLSNGSEWNVYRVAILEIVDWLKRYGDEKGDVNEKEKERAQEEWIENVYDYLVEYYEYTTLFSLLNGRKQIVNEVRLHLCEGDVVESAHVVALALKLEIVHEILPVGQREREASGGIVRSNCVGSSLDAAVFANDTQTVHTLLQIVGYDRDAEHLKLSALKMAIQLNRSEMVDLILPTLTHHILLIAKFNNLISHAAQYNRFNLVRTLLAVRPTVRNTHRIVSLKSEAFCIACRLGNEDFVKEMIKAGHPANSGWSRCEQGSPIIVAARYNHVRIVEILLENGASIFNHDHDTLEVAAQAGSFDVVRLICERDPHIKTRHILYWAFVRALEHNHLKIAKYLWPLLREDRFLHAWPENYQTIALKGAMRNSSFDTLKWLVGNCGVSVRRYPRRNLLRPPTPAVDAICWENSRLFEVLFDLGAEPIDEDDEHVKSTLPEVLSLQQRNMLELNRRWKEAKSAGLTFEGGFHEPVTSFLMIL